MLDDGSPVSREAHAGFYERRELKCSRRLTSFNSRMRDEHWNVEEFTTLTEAQILTEQWRIEYNTIRPHSALDGHPPDQYAEKWQKDQQPTPTLS
jgi:transposase InsO family protein